LKLALEFLEQLGENHWGNRPDVIATIKEALAETDSDAIETLVYMAGLRDGKKMEREKPTHPNLEQVLNSAGFYRRREWEGLTDDFCYIEGSREAERISIPPKREWVGLTELEKAEITSLKWWDWEDTFDLDGFIKALEAKLKEKNNG
jgi:hypothetical protein